MEEFRTKYTDIELVKNNDSTDVYTAINNETKEKVSINVLKNKSDNRKYINNMECEIEELKNLTHENLIGINEISKFVENNTTYYYIETEYFKGKSLWNEMVFNNFSDRHSLEIISQVAEGLKEFHHRGISYNTLTPEDIFIDSEGVIKIDVLSYLEKKYDNTQEDMYEDEFDEGKDRDIYAIGLILYQLVTKDYNLKLRKLKKNVEDEEIYSIIYSLITNKEKYKYENLNEFISDVNMHIERLPIDSIVESSKELESDEYYEDQEEDYASGTNRSVIKKVAVCAAVLLLVVSGAKGLGIIGKDDKKPTQHLTMIEDEPEEDVVEEETPEEDLVADSQGLLDEQQENTDEYVNDYNSNDDSNNTENIPNSNNTVNRPNSNNNTGNRPNNNLGNNNNTGNNNNSNGGNNNNNDSNDNNDTITPPSQDNGTTNPGDDNSNSEEEEIQPDPEAPTPEDNLGDGSGDTGDNNQSSEITE